MTAKPLPLWHNLEIYRGDTKPIVLTLGFANAPFDLSGGSARLEVQEGDADTGPVLIAVESPEVSGIKLEVLPATANAPTKTRLTIRGFTDLEQAKLIWLGKRFYYDLQITDAQGVRQTYLTGEVLITRDRTRGRNP